MMFKWGGKSIVKKTRAMGPTMLPFIPPPPPTFTPGDIGPIILVLYCPGNDLVKEEFRKFINDLVKDSLGDQAVLFMLPTVGEVRLECINPRLATKAKIDATTAILNVMQNTMKNFF